MAGSAVLAAVALAMAVAAFLAADPLRLGPFAHFPGFETYAVEQLPRWSEWPKARDARDRLAEADNGAFGRVQGPESAAFDPSGRGPYAGVADGRVVFWDGEKWTEFATTSPFRTEELCGVKATMPEYLKNEHLCGRPLGLRFDRNTGDLYIADAYFGLLKVGPAGGLAMPLTTSAEGVAFRFTNDLDIDEDGTIYFTDSSAVYYRRTFLQLFLSSEPSGRLLKYDPRTNETTVLLRGLQFPNGVTLSKDKSFLVFCDGVGGRLNRYWLKGEKARTAEPFAVLPGYSDNVRTNDKGEFWVAVHCRPTMYGQIISRHPLLKKLVMTLPIPTKYHYQLYIGGRMHGMVARYSSDGELLEVLEDSQGKVVKVVSDVEERDGKLYMGSVLMPFIAVLNYSTSS